MNISIKDISKLRTDTCAGIMDCKKALLECGCDFDKAKKYLQKKGLAKAAKKAGRETNAGIIEVYSHLEDRIGVLVKLTCETDFVARNSEFKKLGHEICLQIASMKPKNVASLLKQSYIRDQGMTIQDLVKQTIAKLGENIKVEEFKRMEV